MFQVAGVFASHFLTEYLLEKRGRIAHNHSAQGPPDHFHLEIDRVEGIVGIRVELKFIVELIVMVTVEAGDIRELGPK